MYNPFDPPAAAELPPRRAELADLAALNALERECFDGDRLSPRSFRYFLTKSQAQIWVVGTPIDAYGLLLFHRGTSLARVYSLAVAASARGRGRGRLLMQTLERAAEAQGALFIRLEVADDNLPAIALYKAMGYVSIAKLHDYYEDGQDGVRMEKRLLEQPVKPANLPYYSQTTEFTCGPAALIMAAQSLRPDQPADRITELSIWREATTVYMATGHGGTSPYGLALAAHRRGLRAEVWVSARGAPFLQSVRGSAKRKVMELIHEDFMERVHVAQITVRDFPMDVDHLRTALAGGWRVVLLISTYRLSRFKAPHWIWLVAIDAHFAYFNDPDVDHAEYKFQMDCIYIPVPLADFVKMMRYGVDQFKAAVLVRSIDGPAADAGSAHAGLAPVSGV